MESNGNNDIATCNMAGDKLWSHGSLMFGPSDIPFGDTAVAGLTNVDAAGNKFVKLRQTIIHQPAIKTKGPKDTT